jgi:hypothetical protein
MIIDGQSRGATIDEVIGEDYKAFCDDIIEEMPHLTKKERIIEDIQMFFTAIGMLTLIHVIVNLLGEMIEKSSFNILDMEFVVTSGYVVGYLLFSLGIVNLINDISKNAFKESMSKIRIIIYIVVYLIVPFLSIMFSTRVLFKISYFIAILVATVIYILGKIEIKKYESKF